MTIITRREARGAHGPALWHTADVSDSMSAPVPSLDVLWIGSGAGLFLVFGDALVRIEHPTADGQYQTLREADAAAHAFVGA